MSDNQAIQRALEWERIAGSPARTQFNWSRRMLLAMRDFTGGGGGGGTTFSDADFELYNEITNSKVAMFDVSVISGSTTRTFTLPDADGTIVLLTAAQTLLNKTLTQPTIDMGTNQITNAGNPTLPQDVVTKAYADALVTGEFWSDVAVATTANVTLGSDLDIGDTIDGYVLVAGDRILVKDQTDQTENGLYDVGGTRSADAAIADDIEERKAIPLNGTAGANTLFFNTNSEITLGVTNIEFVKLLVDAVPPVAVTTFADGSFAVYNTSDITKEILFDASGIATGTSRTITMPDADGQILSATEYTDLTDAGDSALHYHDTDRARANHTGTQLAATISDLATAVNGIVASETIDNIFRIKDNADNTKEIAFEASTISTGTTRTATMPDYDGTIVLAPPVVDGQVIGGVAGEAAWVDPVWGGGSPIGVDINYARQTTTGTFTSGAYRVRALDSQLGNNLASLAANTLTILVAGSYEIAGEAVSVGAGENRLAIELNGSVTDVGINASDGFATVNTVKQLQINDEIKLVHRADSTGTFGTSNALGDILLIHSDTTDGSTIFVDSALGTTITPFGDVQHSTDIAPPTGMGATSIQFDGAGDYLTLPSFDWLSGNEFSIEFFVYFNDLTGEQWVIGNTVYFNIRKDVSNNLRLNIWNGSTQSNTFAFAFTATTWTHVRIDGSDSVIKAYKDGVQVGSDWAQGWSPPSFVMEIGRQEGDPVNYLDGYLDEIKMSTIVDSVVAVPTTPYVADTGSDMFAELKLTRLS